ncbi:MAG: HAD family hydrolase [Deltaproteobacteria bacterium RIFOXYD12_FULL_50_9]|nr:MAG: HAD family hydrolase [Deltaproteobacteria bacterium RIFOXYD12_FULL_50_9]
MKASRSQTIEAVIFDLDGTLLDTLADLADSVNRVLLGKGLPDHPLDAYRYFVGEGATMLIRRALPKSHQDEATIQAFLNCFIADYSKNWHVSTRPYPGIPEMLTQLASRDLQLAVLSNKPDDFTKLCVTRFLPATGFAAVFGQRPETARKPDPAGALAIARLLDLPPAAFLYLGDTGIDMETAKVAGMFAVGATWGFRPAAELLQHGAQEVINHPAELINLL